MKKHVIIGSVICLATMFIYAVFWGQLPAEIPVHFDVSGQVDSTMPKALVVFGTPVIFTAIHLLACFSLWKKQEKRVVRYYLCPAIAVVVVIVTLVFAL